MAGDGRLFTSASLSSNLINCVTQDRYGYIWVGTEYGLSRFDGYRFTNYLHSTDTTSVMDNTITCFLTDRDGTLWIGTAHGLMSYDRATDGFVRYEFVKPRSPRPRVYSLLQTRGGDLLVGTAGSGLFRLKDGGSRQLVQVSGSTSATYYCRKIFEDSHGNIWQSSHLPVINKFGGDKHMAQLRSPLGPAMAFVESADKQHLYIACQNGILDYDQRRGTLAPSAFDMSICAGGYALTCATTDSQGNLYIGTSDNGAFVFPRGSHKAERLAESNAQHFNLSTAWVNDIVEDKGGNLWIGCYKKGLYLISGEQNAMAEWSFSRQGYAIGSGVSSLAAGDDGDVWCAVQNSGIYHVSSQGVIDAHPASPAGTNYIYRDRGKAYWVGTPNGLYAYNPLTGSADRRLSFVSEGGIYDMADRGDGLLYISVYSQGLYIYDTRTGSVEMVNGERKTKRGYLRNDWVRSLALDATGHLWLATSYGLSCMNTATRSFVDYGWNIQLEGVQCNVVVAGMGGYGLLVGTDQGLYSFDKQRRKVVPFAGAEVLRDKQIKDILCDGRGDLWLSTNAGIWRYDHASRCFVPYLFGGGRVEQEYALGAATVTSDGTFCFGAADGMTAFRPDEARQLARHLGKAWLTSLTIDGRSVATTDSVIVVAPNASTLVMTFSLLDYKNADNVSFRYRLDGGGWQTTPEGINAISMAKLSPGSYTLSVCAVLGGEQSGEVSTFNILVRSPWYLTTLAKMVYALLLASLVALAIMLYERRRHRELEEQKMQFLINATHDIRSPLTLILGPLGKLQERIKGEDRRYLDIIDRNARRLLLLVNQILDERKIDKKQMHLHCQQTDMVAFVQNICSLYQYNAVERGIDLRFEHATETLMVWFDRINFDKVVNNLISNSFKYTSDGGEIVLRLDSDDKYAVLVVDDNGSGFGNEVDLKKLFSRFYQGTNAIHGTGIGLNLSQSIMQLHGGTITARNRADVPHGASFTVRMPLVPVDESTRVASGEPATPATRGTSRGNRRVRVLVVDDDRELTQYIENELSQWYSFKSCANGQEALDELLAVNAAEPAADTSRRYDIVVSDVVMPVMDGISLLKQVKGNSLLSDLPVVLLTSKSAVEDRLAGLRQGADGYLGKPFSIEELHVLIDNLVDTVRRLRGKYAVQPRQAEQMASVKMSGNDDQLVRRIAKAVGDHLSDPEFGVEGLCADVGLSRAQLHRKMKELMGVSASDYIRNQRLEQALRLLQQGDVNVSQVAFAVGFNNQAHFSTVFRKHFGKSPTEYVNKK